MKEPQLQAPSIDLKNTTAITNSEGGSVFQQGVILRKISKFVTGTSEDAVLPIPVFFDPVTKKIFAEGLPKELREALADETI
tara:strand:+ start:211 stop:456 length:246 start_codon:yes stop_codon:yes gene_type:complete